MQLQSSGEYIYPPTRGAGRLAGESIVPHYDEIALRKKRPDFFLDSSPIWNVVLTRQSALGTVSSEIL